MKKALAVAIYGFFIVYVDGGCARPPHPPSTLRVVEMVVKSVPNGATLEIQLSERRTSFVTLSDIAAPTVGEPLADESRMNLEQLAGDRIRVEIPRRLGLMLDVETGKECLDDEAIKSEAAYQFQDWFEWHVKNCKQCAKKPTSGDSAICMESFVRLQGAMRGSLSGVAYGESGVCLQLGQLEAGLARHAGIVPKEWIEAEYKAQKAKIGIWK